MGRSNPRVAAQTAFFRVPSFFVILRFIPGRWIFSTRTCMWCPQCSRQAWNMEKLTFSREKYLNILILSRKKMIWTLLCKLWLYFTLALHPSDQHVLHYIAIIKKKWKIKQFLTNLCDLIKYIMKYNRIWVMEQLQLASSYTWQLMRLMHI